VSRSPRPPGSADEPHRLSLGHPAPAPADAEHVGLLGAFDRRVDRGFDHLRGRPAVDGVAAVVSNLADYGFVWAVVSASKARRRGARRRALRALSLAGISSALVNGGVKAMVSRPRPQRVLRAGLTEVLPVRRPSSSSFPSGHTLAAFCTAVILADSGPEAAAYLGFAGAVALSRVHLRDHHASDVVAGAALGSAVGLAGRLVLRRR
jgi:undecaprenyl-diphosphatase